MSKIMTEEIFNKIKRIIKKIPDSPGVYKMLGKDEKIIYIGKAKNLKHRVAQYFQLSKAHANKVKKMIESIHDVSYIETDTEFEALVLETNLIKEHRPKYNILMKDDKNYVYIKITVNEDFPRVLTVRQREKDGAVYFGPKSSASAVDKMMDIIRKIFPTRTCNLDMTRKTGELIQIKNCNIPIPCLEHHIKRCNAPCVNKESKEDYNQTIKKTIHFLKGNFQELITKLKYEMFNAADGKDFETAARLRDKVKSVEETFLIQKVSEPDFIDRDVIGIYPDFGKVFINLFRFREGKLIGQENFTLNYPETSAESPLETFIKQYYSESTEIPTEILIREIPLDREIVEEWLTTLYHSAYREGENPHPRRTVKLITAQKGTKEKILKLSEKNAKSFAKQSQAKWISDTSKTVNAAKDLADELGLDSELKRIECYDISHLGGEHTTASMVVFQNGAPSIKEYRHFKIKNLTEGEIDDYKCMEEVLTRRLKRLAEFTPQDVKGYEFKKPLKKDQEMIIEKILTLPLQGRYSKGGEGLDWKETIAAYNKDKLVGFTQLLWDEGNENAQIVNLTLEPDHNSHHIAHAMIFKLIEKTKLQKIYTVTDQNNRELWEKYGFTELKKIPPFLKPTTTESKELHNSLTSRPIYLIHKITKKKQKEDSSFSKIPDLIIVDGGKGQLSTAQKVIDNSGLGIPVIGLAKKEEEIFINDVTHRKRPTMRIKLARNAQSLYLVQRIRDEAHRFANELRKKLGTKKLTASEIDDIPGIGLIIKRKLLKEYGSINKIKEAPMEELEKCVGTYIAKMLKAKL